MATDIERVILQGLTFGERRHFAEIAPAINHAVCAVGQTRLSDWRHWLTQAGRDPAGWEHFLADEKLTEKELAALARCFPAKWSAPEWAMTLRRIFGALEKGSYSGRAHPVAQYALSEFRQRLGPRVLSLLSPATQLALTHSLGLRLAQSARRVANDSEAFSAGDSSKLATLRMMVHYPALARLWAVQVNCWLRFVGDFAGHLEEFVRDCNLRTSASRHPIEAIESDLSDLHEGNRSVMGVRFANGRSFYYKPRSGKHELEWFSLLEWLNQAGFRPAFKIAKVFSRRAYCWMEAIPQRECRSRKQAAHYYFRAGATLYLINLLRGVDFHAGNIIAHGGEPVLIDCETLFHPELRISRRVTHDEEGSILRTGMLPLYKSVRASGEEMSALGRRHPGPHSVRVNGRLVLAAQFVEEVIAGFTAMHSFLRPGRNQSVRLRKILARFGKLRCRYLYRPTTQYAWMREHSLSPRILGDGLDRSLFLHALCRDGLIPHRHVHKEVNALENGDVPIFYGTPSRARQQPDKRLTESVALLKKSLLSG